MTNFRTIAILLFISFAIISCRHKPEPINYELDLCAFCKMSITDTQFGAEIVTKKGKVYKFDSMECMVNFLNVEENKEKEAKLILTVDYSLPKQLIDAQTAYYVHTDSIPSPMGANILSFEDKAAAEKLISKYTGELLTWEQVTKQILSNSEN